MTQTRAIDAFVDAGLLAHNQGVLDTALVELGIRLDLAGAGDLLTQITDTCWAATDRHEECPHCGARLKGTPNPHQPGQPQQPPTPPPPPPPEK